MHGREGAAEINDAPGELRHAGGLLQRQSAVPVHKIQESSRFVEQVQPQSVAPGKLPERSQHPGIEFPLAQILNTGTDVVPPVQDRPLTVQHQGDDIRQMDDLRDQLRLLQLLRQRHQTAPGRLTAVDDLRQGEGDRHQAQKLSTRRCDGADVGLYLRKGEAGRIQGHCAHVMQQCAV